ncbi:aminomethyltransferase [Aminobacter sp. Y103A]|uniref:CAF17-like 4Fe-4S cluster assembly/insertion protein YgfZ n=1 Tax=Aminobacter sp. Y103A TaxID=1870862 RepID=UPI0025734070|nr:folate-binding protein YgfZ [Aminobacter sp. SS-2016]BBD36994.1 aminomethyltransferase [Aminobacter sp. SS-2016]
MPTAILADRAIIDVSGPDAEHFLQNILTLDLDALGRNEAKPGALLAPQGKIMFDFLVSRSTDNALRLECRADIADDFVRRLMLYRLRAKADISKQDQPIVAITWQDDSAASQTDSTVRDSRFQQPVFRHYGAAPATNTTEADWHTFRIDNGVAESGADYALADAFPHDVLLDQMGGVGFRKGCFIGQEVVSRMQHRGTARRRVLLVSATTALPAPGTEIKADGKVLGALGSVDGSNGLAIARIDRVKAALDAGSAITAGDVTVALAIPAWASFTYPETAGAEDA